MVDSLKNKSVAVAMSGGVDSSVTAALLLQEGATVQGVFMALAQPDLDQQVDRVRGVANALNIPLEVIDLQAPFQEKVIAYFRKTYLAGRTPNPCVVCNRHIKFGLLLERVLTNHELLATGHYARLERDETGRTRLLQGVDPKKDQSYFLNQLTQDQLAKLHFPLGGQHKTEVRKLAANFGLEGVHGSESQDVCFLKGQTVHQFLAGEGAPPGSITTLDGTPIGHHAGLIHYTVGQRRGLGLPDATPYYVVRLDSTTNTVVVGKDADLWATDLTVGPMNWTCGNPPRLPQEFLVKIRYRHQAAMAQVTPGTDGGCAISFAAPQWAVAPGQFAALYQGEELIGGGEIL